MTETNEPVIPAQDAAPPPPPPPPAPAYGSPAPAYAAAPATGAVGQIRSTGTSIVLTIVTLGIYSWVWYYKTHDEMKQHSGQGLGGGVALILAIFVGIVMPFITASEV